MDPIHPISTRMAPEEAREAFSALVLEQALRPMFQSEGPGIFGKGPQAAVYGDWFLSAMAQELAAQGGLTLPEPRP